MSYVLVLIVIYFGQFTAVKSFEPFVLSISCIKDSSMCNKEELEYLSIAELHNQIDDDKNGNIDISESKDFVEDALSFSRGSEKARIFHRDDAQIDKQDLWHIWRTSEVSNWTTNDLLTWLSDDVELPQYINSFTKLKLNGSSLPRLTGNDYLADVLKISNSIHRKKIMIKAVDAVLFGPAKKYQLTTKGVIILLAIFASITIYLFIQILYSKRYVKDMQGKLDRLGETESTLSELRDKIKEAEEFKLKKHNEIQEMEERHRSELYLTKNSSRDSLLGDVDRLHEANKEIAKLKSTLVEYQRQIHELTRQSMTHSIASSDHKDGHLLQSLLQLSYATERQYLSEKISAVDRQSMEFKELNEKVKKKKAGFLGSFRLVHTNDLDELEMGFSATKKAYEMLIHEKNEQESRWNTLESITGLNLIHCGDVSSIRQVIRWTSNSPSNPDTASSCGSINHHADEFMDNSILSNDKPLEETVSFQSEPSNISNQSSSDYSHMDSLDSTKSSLVTTHTVEGTEVHKRSRKDFSDRRRPLFGVGRTRIASLTRSSKKY